jgi:hypothetical protein
LKRKKDKEDSSRPLKKRGGEKKEEVMNVCCFYGFAIQSVGAPVREGKSHPGVRSLKKQNYM